MRALLVTHGTRGDVQPFLALAVALRKRGHEAVLAAGRPQVVCPFVADQPHWANRTHAVGVAPLPLRQKDLTVDQLAGALRLATGDAAMRERAERLGLQIRTENGVDAAVDALEHII